MISIVGTLLFLLAHRCADGSAVRTVANVRVQSILRYHNNIGGNLLKVSPGDSSDTRDLSFTGAHTTDPSTALEMESRQKNSSPALVFRFRKGNNSYYLAAENGSKVLFRKLNSFPSEDKYFFRTKFIPKVIGTLSGNSFKSLATGEWLHSDSNGRAFMKAVTSSALVNGRPRDRKTYFFIM